MEAIFRHLLSIKDASDQRIQTEDAERATVWKEMTGTVITGKQLREAANESNIGVEITVSNCLENGKGYLLRRKNKLVLQVNSQMFAEIRKQKPDCEMLDNLQLTVLPIELLPPTRPMSSEMEEQLRDEVFLDFSEFYSQFAFTTIYPNGTRKTISKESFAGKGFTARQLPD